MTGQAAPQRPTPRGLGRLGEVVRQQRSLGDIAVGARHPNRAVAADATPDTACEMCARPIGETHQHVVNVESRALKCTCRPCWLLFTDAGAGGGRYKAVGTRVWREDLTMSMAVWNALDVPVGMLFVFRNSGLDRPVAFYPSPAGATESELDLQAWDDVIAANPGLTDAQDDVEAVLLRLIGGPGQETFEAYVVPVDVCYALVGLVRLHWKGFDGGTIAHDHIEAFFAALDATRAPASR